MYWYGEDVGGWDYAVMSIVMLAFWGLVITGVVFLLRRARSSRTGEASAMPRTAERLLAERFARGEIDDGEFNSRFSTLHAQVRS